jgi:hypothetical protein
MSFDDDSGIFSSNRPLPGELAMFADDDFNPEEYVINRLIAKDKMVIALCLWISNPSP